MLFKSLKIFLLVSIFFPKVMITAQDFQRLNIPISNNKGLLPYSVAGGLRSPQFSNTDFNGDGIQDLFVFDRISEFVTTFVKTGPIGSLDFIYAPQYESSFPKMHSFAMLRDYNRDGIEDLFTSSTNNPGGIELYRASKDITGKIRYTLVTFNYGLKDVLMIPAGNGYANIYASNEDLFDIQDVDGDSDLDVVAFETAGSFVSFYQNLQVDEALPIDSLKFIRKDICWGRFSESGLDDRITLSNDPFSCANGIVSQGNGGERHSGSTLCLYDKDKDGDFEIVIGDISSNTLTMLTNGGTRENAFMTSVEKGFPLDDISADLSIFLAPTMADINGDGKKDMLVTSNTSAGINTSHVWAYVDVSKNDMVDFELQTKNFLVDKMAFFNSGSSPCFVDVNQDGLVDIIVGNNGIIPNANDVDYKLNLLLNIGTLQNPSFEIVDTNYQDFTQYPTTGRLSPSAGDIDSDGDIDLIVGDSKGKLYLIKNLAGPNKPIVWDKPEYFAFSIFIGNNANPIIYDLDEDNLMDLIIGEKNNQLNFFKNIGTVGNPLFSSDVEAMPNTSELGNIFPNGINPFTQNGDPVLIDMDGDLALIISNEYGTIERFSNIKDPLSMQPFKQEDAKIGNIQAGKFSKIDLANMDGDPFYELVIGNESGGLRFYNTTFMMKPSTTSQQTVEKFDIYPNPASSQIWVDTKQSNQAENLQLFDMNGKMILHLKPGLNDVSSIESGMYLIRMIHHRGSVSKKIIISR